MDQLIRALGGGAAFANPIDHTREPAPLPVRARGYGGRRHAGVLADVGASMLNRLTGRRAELPVRSLIAHA